MNISINGWPKRHVQNPQIWMIDCIASIGLLYSNVITQRSDPELLVGSTEKGLESKNAMPYLVKSHFLFLHDKPGKLGKAL